MIKLYPDIWAGIALGFIYGFMFTLAVVVIWRMWVRRDWHD